MPDASGPRVTIVALTHDLVRKRSVVSLKWTDDPERGLALPVPFGCGLDVVRDEAEKALRALGAEIAMLSVAS
jgi:hypothetical protein